MMDFSIRLVTPQIMRQRGADAFDRGQGIDDHNMNPGTPAIADWQAGWCAQAGVRASSVIKFAMGKGTPP